MLSLSEIRKMSLVERLDYYSQKKDNGCIEFTGTIEQTGYGSIKFHGGRYKAHRAAWIAHKGKIPEGMQVNHSCDNKRCINPEHLWIGTQQDNMDDMLLKGRDNRIGRKGSIHHNTKLTESDVYDIRKKYINGFKNRKLLAEEYGLKKTALHNILANKTWKHVKLGKQTEGLCNDGYAKKLTPEAIEEIKFWHTCKQIKRKDMAKKYGVSMSNIDQITSGKTWKHI